MKGIILAFILVTSHAFSQELVLTEDLIAEKAVTESREYAFKLNELQSGKTSLDLDLRTYLPQLQLSWSDSSSVTNYSPDTYSRQLGLKLSQIILPSMDKIDQRSNTKAQLRLKAAALILVRDQIVSQAVNLFLNCVIGREKLRLIDENLDAVDKQMQIMELQYNQGSLTELDYLQGLLKKKNFEKQRSETVISNEAQENQLRQILNIHDGIALKFDFDLSKKYVPLDIEGKQNALKQMAFTNNTEYLARQMAIGTLQKNLDKGSLTWMPQIGLDLSLSFSGEKFPLYVPSWSASLNFSFPFEIMPFSANAGLSSTSLNTRAVNSGINSSLLPDLGFTNKNTGLQASLMQNRYELETFVRSLEFAVDSFFKTYQLKIGNLELQKQALELEQKKMAIMELQLRQGSIKALDWISARQELLAASLDFAQASISMMLEERSFAQSLGLSHSMLVSSLGRMIQ